MHLNYPPWLEKFLTNGLGKLKELVIRRVMFPKPALLCLQFVSVLRPAH